ncbi:hypothetical protein N7478_005214 [Penicillium angulare]|uniref:uncharacterized protein n=1 Tax=Penicillium angulare TaxID=116970 RepID=UPI0025405D5D|nr:uncharacterized protein N7478_005214 [Penicillium angulare]KAJ5279842.1 hypothetical protein N7478_005214 [Penicillium angulare]
MRVAETGSHSEHKYNARSYPEWFDNAFTIFLQSGGNLNDDVFDEDLSLELDDEEDSEYGYDDDEEDDDDAGEIQDPKSNEHVKDDLDKFRDKESLNWFQKRKDDLGELREEEDLERERLKEARIEKQKAIDCERSVKAKVDAAFKSALNATNQEHVQDLALERTATTNDIYSIEYVVHFDIESRGMTKNVEFCDIHAFCDSNCDICENGKPRAEINGHIYIDPRNCPDLKPFVPPRTVSNDACLLDVECSSEVVEFMFFDKGYLKMKIAHEIIFQGENNPSNSSEIFEYVGVRVDI